MSNDNKIQNRYDFVILFDVKDGNPNGDPDAGNLPRVDAETGHGLITDVCLKRKIRNYVALKNNEQPPYAIFVKEKAILNNTISQAYLSLGIDLGLLLKGFFILSIGIFLLIYDKKVFAYFMIIFGWMGLVFLFNSLGHNGFLGLTVNQTDAISGVLLVVGTTIAIVVATFWLKYNV